MRVRRANEDPKLKGAQRGTEDVTDSGSILAPPASSYQKMNIWQARD